MLVKRAVRPSSDWVGHLFYEWGWVKGVFIGIFRFKSLLDFYLLARVILLAPSLYCQCQYVHPLDVINIALQIDDRGYFLLCFFFFQDFLTHLKLEKLSHRIRAELLDIDRGNCCIGLSFFLSTLLQMYET